MIKKNRLQLGKIGKATILAIAIALAGRCFGVIEVNAGFSNVIIDSSSFQETLDTSKWNVPEEDVVVLDGKLVFSADSTQDTRLITKEAVSNSNYKKELFSANYTINLQEVPKEQKYIVAYSVATIESYSEEAESVELIFENRGGLKASLVAYDEDGEAEVLVAPKSVAISQGKNFTVSVQATTKMKLKVQINGRTFFEGQSPVDLEGRLGFFQTGKCRAQISALNIVSYKYDRPENANIIEDFESGTINTNTLTSRMTSSCAHPSGVHVEEYNGSQVLMFKNVNMGYIGTRNQYSNFELEFDIPYMLHNAQVREDGTLISPQHTGFVVSFGGDSAEYEDFGYGMAAEGVIFSNGDSRFINADETVYTYDDKNYYDVEKDEGFSVKIRVVDARAHVYVKTLHASKYDELFSGEIGNITPLGYIHIWSMGQSNFAIDNLKVTNLDDNPNINEVEYKGYTVTGTDDWVYEPVDATYLEATDTNEKNFVLWKVIVAGEIFLSVVILAVCITVVKRRKKSSKGGNVE